MVQNWFLGGGLAGRYSVRRHSILCEHYVLEVVIINRTEDSRIDTDLATDVLEIITVFSARLYGSRSHKNKKIVEELRSISEKL